jgi:hypothetical protein
MRKFWGYLGGTIIKPYGSFSRLCADSHALQHSLGAILFIGVLYTLTVIGLAIAGADIATPACINIPAQDYYFWEIFFAAPVYILGWILAAGIAQLISKIFRGKGTFEGTLATLGFAITIPSFVTWIPETIGTVLFLSGIMTQKEWQEIIARPGFWQVFANVYIFVGVAWYLVLIPLSVAASQKIRWWQSAIVGIVTTVIIGFIMFVFIR